MDNTQKLPKITDFINGKVTYDKEGAYLWIHGNSNGIQMLGQVRGWGHIQNMFVKTGQIDIQKASEYQDKIGEFLAQAINEKIGRINSDNKKNDAIELKIVDFNNFLDWHKKQGYISIKKEDYEEYLNTKRIR